MRALPSLIEMLPRSADIFLDDAYREGESSAVSTWLKQYPERLKSLGTVPVGTGLAWLRVT